MMPNSVEHRLQQAIALLQSCLKELGSNSDPVSVPAMATAVAPDFGEKRVAAALDISPDQVPELFELRDKKLYMHVKPLGNTVADRQRCLVHALLIGYKFGLGISNVRLSLLADAADEWGIKGGHFSRDIQGKYVQVKGGGKGSDPLVSLAPGAVERVKDGIKAMLMVG